MAGFLFSPPRLRAVSTAGDPIPGAKLYWYQAGTSVLASTFTTASLTLEHQNPQIANLAGEFQTIYLDPEAGFAYKAVCTTPTGAQLWAEDDIPAGIVVTGDEGPTGPPGLSVAELKIFQRASSAPETPTGGSFDFSTQSLSAPDGWSVTVPSGNEPLYVSTTVAAVEGDTGTDNVLTWSAPVIMAQDGSSVDIVFKRSATQPATPSPSTGVPAGWYTDVDSVPASSDKLWSSVGTRDNASQNWIWQLPIQVEGDQGLPGVDAALYYIKPIAGTAIKNGTGQLTVEAHKVFGGNDILLNSGTIQLYVGSTLVTAANGYVAGSNGYTGIFDSGDIAGAVTVTLKNGAAGDPLDTITLVDVADGTADTGKNAVYGYIEANQGLAWVRAADGVTWNPSSTTTRLDCTFVQAGADVARVAWLITRDSSGILTGATTTHGGGDLNSGRVTVTEINESSQAMTVKFSYAYSGDVSLVMETVIASVAGAGVQGDPGADGDDGVSATYLTVTAKSIPLFAYQNGLVASYAGATGTATVWNGSTNVTSSSTLSIASSSNVTGAAITAGGTYSITGLTADNGYITIQAIYSGQTITERVSFFKQYAGYEIVGSLPYTNLFAGRIVYLTTDGKLYRYTGSAWTRAVDGADITANSIYANSLRTGSITAAYLAVTQLSAITADIGTISAGILQSSTGNTRFDLNNARVIYNSAPGYTGGYVRVQGAGFGPSLNYLDWYGPKPAGQYTDSGIIANLTDVGAFYYLKTDGESKSVTQRIRGEFEPKCWVRCSGTNLTPGGAQTIGDCYNVSSVTRYGSANGTYVVTFAEALGNAEYCAVGSASSSSSNVRLLTFTSRTTSSLMFEVRGREDGNLKNDADYIAIIIYGSNVVGGTNVTQPLGGTGGGTKGWGNLPSNKTLP